MAYELTPEQKKWVVETHERLDEMKANGGFEPPSESLQDRMNEEERTNFFLRRRPEVVKMHEEVNAKLLAEILAKYPRASDPEKPRTAGTRRKNG